MEENGRALSGISAARTTLVSATIDTVASKNVFIRFHVCRRANHLQLLGHTWPYSVPPCVLCSDDARSFRDASYERGTSEMTHWRARRLSRKLKSAEEIFQYVPGRAAVALSLAEEFRIAGELLQRDADGDAAYRRPCGRAYLCRFPRSHRERSRRTRCGGRRPW